VISLPCPATDVIKLADWVEVSALLARDHNASKGDLERVLRRSGILENLGADAVDSKCVDVFRELEARAITAGGAYPFESRPGLLSARRRVEDYPVYVFCLCLSFLPWKQKKGGKIFPRRMFEALSTSAAKVYLGGNVLRFASPRDELPKSFVEALNVVCERIREGGGYRTQPTPKPNDDTVDIIAWKPFPDTRPGQVMLFGQCASGQDVRAKRSELQASAFCQQWMLYHPASPLIHALFIPHHIEPKTWEALTRRAGIVFDRGRLARLLHGTGELPKARDYVAWSKTVLRAARA
jgi:hypothetical protein